ncbi:MAG: hypothetical protein RLZZ70_7 [Candidatus Parcubacteria bacterium]|jgi:hypothetical protein
MAFGGNPEHNLIRKERASRSMEDIASTVLPLHAECAKRLKAAAIKRSDFSGMYDQKSLNEDAAYVRYCEQQFALAKKQAESHPSQMDIEDTKKISEVLEYLIFSGINNANWIPFTQAIKTSDYDDYKHKIDLVLEFVSKATTGHIGLGIDVTFSNDIDKKLKTIKDEIDNYDGKNNQLGKVKYYHSKQSGKQEELSGIPRVVVAIDIDVLDDLIQSRDQKNHIIRHIIITEIIEQLHVFAEYAQRVNPACVPNFTKALRLLTVIQDALRSEQTLEESEYFKNRKMNDRLSRGLEIFSHNT